MWLALFLLLTLAGCGTWKPKSVESLYERAQTLLQGEHYQAARSTTEQALKGVEPGSAWYWRLRLLRVESLVAQREFQQAQQALDFQIPPGPQWNVERARYDLCLANVEYRRQNLGKAGELLAEAHTLAAAARDSRVSAEIELRQATLDAVQHRFAEAEAKIRRVLDFAGRGNNHTYLRLQAAGNLGFVLLRAYRWEEAIPWFEKAMAMARELGAADSEPRAMLNLGWCYYRLGDLDKAQHYFQEAESRFESNGNRYESQNCLGNMASTLSSRHEYEAAASAYQRALDIAVALKNRQFQAQWLNNLASNALETEDWNIAERYNNSALALSKDDASLQPYLAANAGYIAAGKRDFSKAEELFRSVIRTSHDPVPVLNAHAGLVHAFLLQGKFQEAGAEYRATDTYLEKQRSGLLSDQDKLTYFSSLIGFYQDYVQYMLASGRVREALEAAESSRTRAMTEKLQLARKRRGPVTAAGFQQIAAACRCTLLSYWVAPKTSYVWAITRDALEVFPLPPEAAIRKLVENYDALIQNARDPLVAESLPGRQLYDALIAPVRPLLARNSRVILVPDGPLYALNFETLPVFDANPHYWIEDVDLTISPSLNLLSAGRQAPERASRSLLLIGNPVSPLAQYPALDYAAREIASIEQSLPAFRKVVVQGADADPEAYSLAGPGKFGLIHFVAHGVANPQEPLNSAVILSRHGTDYKLLAKDVIATPLDADLVTISACRSAGARTYAGEGLVGFAWAFLEAGARNVIAGLWDVNDRSTADLVGNLYAGLGRGAAPGAALRAAKLGLIHSTGAYRKPYYWGPFELFTREPR